MGNFYMELPEGDGLQSFHIAFLHIIGNKVCSNCSGHSFDSRAEPV